MEYNQTSGLRAAFAVFSLLALNACGDSNKSLARSICESELNKRPEIANLPSDQKESILELCVREAEKAIKERLQQ